MMYKALQFSQSCFAIEIHGHWIVLEEHK